MPSRVSLSEPTYLSSGSIVRRGERDGGALGGESFGDRLAEPTAAARDERDLPCTSTGHESRYYARARTAARPRPPASSARAARCRRRRAARRRRVEPHLLGARRRRGGSWSRLRHRACRRSSIATCCARRGSSGRCTAPRCRCPRCCGRTPATRPTIPPLFVMSFVEGTSLEPLFDQRRRRSRARRGGAHARRGADARGAPRARPGVDRPRRRAGGRPAARRSTAGAGCSRRSTRGSLRAGTTWPSLLRRARTGADARRGRARRLPARQPPRGRCRPSPRSSTGRSGASVTRGSTSAGSSPTPTPRRTSARRATRVPFPSPAELLEVYAGALGRDVDRHRVVPGVGVLQVDGDVVADRQAQPPPRRAGPGGRGDGRGPAASPRARALLT